ncbi:MAG TPA: hypothetical protein VMG10_29725 [Gemmataceae bacterium]|nr:hypothetical protein [Gemmataceae bacterium]
MANDPRKRQKKLERRASKRKEKRHVRIREQSAGLAERLSAAVKFPVLNCWIGDSIAEQGIGWVVLSRAMPNGSVAAASFLVDSYCLGVKNVHAEILPRSEYEDKYLRHMMAKMPSRDAAPAEARKLLEGAVAYAREIGFSPHPDYPRVMVLFGDIKAADSDAHFEFGKDGKPFFVSGPNDSSERCKQIVAILHKTCGPGQYDYVVVAGSPQSMLDDPDAGEEYVHEIEDYGDEER